MKMSSVLVFGIAFAILVVGHQPKTANNKTRSNGTKEGARDNWSTRHSANDQKAAAAVYTAGLGLTALVLLCVFGGIFFLLVCVGGGIVMCCFFIPGCALHDRRSRRRTQFQGTVYNAAPAPAEGTEQQVSEQQQSAPPPPPPPTYTRTP